MKFARLTAKGRKMMAPEIAAELRWASQLACNFEHGEIAIARDVIQRLKRILADMIVGLKPADRHGCSVRKPHQV